MHSTRRDFLHLLSGAALTGALFRQAHADEARKKPPIRIGQIGVGHAHASKLAVFRKSPEYEVVGIVEPDAALQRSAQSQPAYKDLKWLTQEQLLNTPGLEAVLVETRVRDLLPTAETCVAAGKHVHIDKPAGDSLPALKRILYSAEQQRLIVQMGYMYRYNPGVVLLRNCLKQGWLGDPFEVHTVMSKVVPPGDRKKLAEFSGGIMFELGCHVIDLVIGLLGQPTAVQASARHVSKLDDGLLDNMLAVFSYPSALATVKSSAVEVEGGDRRHLVLCGTEGTLHIQPLDKPRVRVAFSKPHDTYRAGYQDVDVGPYERYVDDAADFARIIRGEKANDFSYAHDLAVQETLLRACGMDQAL